MVELSSLELSDVTLMPMFASDTTMYTSEVPYETMMTTVTTMDTDVDTVEVEIMPADADMTMEGHQVELAAGTSTMIMVTAMKEYGGTFTEEYMVDVMRADMPAEATFMAMRSADGMSVDLEWPAVTGATRHIVFLISGASLEAEGASLDDYELIMNGSATTHTFSGLDAAQDYTIVLVSGTPDWVLPWDEAMSAGN